MSQNENNSPSPNVTFRRQKNRRPRREISLFELIMDGRTDEALEVIESDNYNPNSRDGDDNTYLIAACQNEMTTVALTLIDTGKSKPSAINYRKETALMIACEKGLIDVALELIQTGESCPECKNIEGETALLFAAKSSYPNMDTLVKELLNTGKSLPHDKDIDGYTALSNAISRDNIKSAIEILNYDKTTANSVTDQGETPLMIATDINADEIALLLIKTGQSHPEYAEDNYSTALMNACRNKMNEVALDIIKTGKSNQFIQDNFGKTAIDYAEEEGLNDVVDAINALGTSDIEININANGFNSEQQENIQIQKYLAEHEDNICFKFENNYILTEKSTIIHLLNNPQNIKYKCKKEGDNKYNNTNNDLIGYDFTGDQNIIYSKKYFSLSSLTGLQLLVSVDELQNIINNKNASNMFCLSVFSKASSIISEAYIQGIAGVGADHCQPGKSTDICAILRGIAVCGPKETNVITNITLTDNTINIQYKTNTIKMTFENNQSIGELKDNFLQKLVSLNLIDNSTNKIVKFIYKGKIYGNDKNRDLVSSMPDFTPGQTLSAQIITTTGGKKLTKRRRKGNKSKRRYTKKRYFRK